MSQLIFTSRLAVLIVSALVQTLIGCSKDDAGSDALIEASAGPILPLALPKRIEIVRANDAPETPATAMGSELVAAALATDPGTDYMTDPVESFTYANGNIGVDLSNGILCILDKMEIASHLNKGPYQVSLPQNICVEAVNQDDSAAQEVALLINLQATRADNHSDQVIKMWVDNPEPTFNSRESGALKAIGLIEIVVHKGVDATSRLGRFDVMSSDYVDASLGGGTTGSLMVVGKLKLAVTENIAGLPRVEVFYNGYSTVTNSFDFELRSILQFDDAQANTGSEVMKTTSVSSTNYVDTTIAVSRFDQNILKSVNSSTPTGGTMVTTEECRARGDVQASHWEYNLYHHNDATFRAQTVRAGQRVNLGSAGTVLSFDYVHDAANDRLNTDSTSNFLQDKVFYLTYYNDSKLPTYGIQDANGNLHKLSFKDGTKLANTEGEFLTKATVIGYELKLVSADQCAHLDVSSLQNDPAMDLSKIQGDVHLSFGPDSLPAVPGVIAN